MKKGTIVGLSIGTVLLIGGIIFLLFWKKSPLYIKKNELGDVEDQNGDSDGGSSGGSSGGSVSSCTEPSTGLKCRNQGDDFRGWIHKAYPAVATEFDLDESHRLYDNCTMRRVWAHQPHNSTKPLGETWKSISLGWEKLCD